LLAHGASGQSIKEKLLAHENDFLFQFTPSLRAFNFGKATFNVDDAKAACTSGPITPEFIYTCMVLKNAQSFNPAPITGGTGQ
jgi:hypothetical protein